MTEQKDPVQPQEEQIPPFRGLYRHVKVSVKALDCVIAVCIAVILIVVFLELRDPGLSVTFDSKGGTDVPSQSQMYGELLDVPQPPTREGYVFTGWYTDSACQEQWDAETRTIETDLYLYAGWEKIE